MNFVFVSYNYSGGFDSPQEWVNRIKAYAGSLACLGKNHTVHRVEQINYSGDYLHNGIQYHFTRFGNPGSHFPRQLNRFVKQLRPDVVIVNGTHYPLQAMQLRAILPKKVKLIVQHHAEQPFTGLKKYLQRWASCYVDAYLFASHDLGMDWVKKGNITSPQKIHEVMEVSSVFYVIDKNEAKAKTNVNRQPVFLFVGRLNQNKDPLMVVRAFLQFAEIQPAVRLYMIFHTDELLGEINELLKAHPHKESVSLIGKVPNEELLYWYNSADFILSASHYEGSGTSICEGMSCGCIPIVTDIFSFRMITEGGKCGLLYEAGKQVALLNALIETQQMDVTEKRKLSLNQFKNKLSFEAIAKQIEDVVGSL